MPKKKGKKGKRKKDASLRILNKKGIAKLARSRAEMLLEELVEMRNRRAEIGEEQDDLEDEIQEAKLAIDDDDETEGDDFFFEEEEETEAERKKRLEDQRKMKLASKKRELMQDMTETEKILFDYWQELRSLKKDEEFWLLDPEDQYQTLRKLASQKIKAEQKRKKSQRKKMQHNRQQNIARHNDFKITKIESSEEEDELDEDDITITDPVPIIKEAFDVSLLGRKALLKYLRQPDVREQLESLNLTLLRLSLQAALYGHVFIKYPLNVRCEMLWRFSCTIMDFDVHVPPDDIVGKEEGNDNADVDADVPQGEGDGREGSDGPDSEPKDSSKVANQKNVDEKKSSDSPSSSPLSRPISRAGFHVDPDKLLSKFRDEYERDLKENDFQAHTLANLIEPKTFDRERHLELAICGFNHLLMAFEQSEANGSSVHGYWQYRSLHNTLDMAETELWTIQQRKLMKKANPIDVDYRDTTENAWDAAADKWQLGR